MNNNDDTLESVLDKIAPRSWRKLALGSAVVLFLVSGALLLSFANLLVYQSLLMVLLVSYFPLSYLSFLQSRAKDHKKRIKEDNELLGLTTEDELERIYGQIYSPQQFIIYISMAVLATLLGFGLFHFRELLEATLIARGSAEIMFYSFLGAYIFSVYYVYRRYVTLDLQPNVYLYITARIFTVQAVALVAARLLQTDDLLTQSLVPIVAFIIGYLPDTGIRWITSLTTRYLGSNLRKEQPLSDVDGISLWHETRLRESGIDNVQNLAAADVRELVLNSRFSTQQLMHWIDQAILMTNLPEKYTLLRQHGICTISAVHQLLEGGKQVTLPFLSLPENENGDGDKDSTSLTLPDLKAAYYAADLGPNLHYVVQYWQAIKEFRTVVVQQNRAKLVKQQIAQAQTADGKILYDVLTDQLEQMIKNFNLAPEDLETTYQNSPDQLAELGGVYIQREQYPKAVEVLTKAIDLDGQNVAAYRARGSAWSMQNKNEEAFDDFKEAKELAPDDAVTLNSEGSAYLRQGNYLQAINAYQEAIKLTPDYSSAYLNLGRVYALQSKYTEALHNFDQAIRCAPERDQAYLERGSIHLRQKHYDEAIEDFSTAIRYNRGNARGYNDRAVAHMRKDENWHAIYDLDTAIDIDPNQAAFYFSRAQAHWKVDHLQETIDDCTQAIKLNRNLAAAYKTRSRAYQKAAKLSKAIADIERYLEYNPRDKAKAKEYLQELQQLHISKETDPGHAL